MAVLGLQAVFSLIMFTFLHKLGPYYSIGRWLLNKRLYRYLHPTNEELKQLATGSNDKPAQTGKAKKRSENRRNNMPNDKKETFTVPRNIPLSLDQARVETVDLIQLQYYSEYIWIMDFSFCALIVYIFTELYYIFSPYKIEFNISLLWCLLAIIFCCRILAAQAWLYLKTEDGGERVLLITFTFFFLVFVMGVLVIGDRVIELGLEEGYKNFSDGAKLFLEKQEVSNHKPLSFLTLKIFLALFGTLAGGLLTFPGLRVAKLHLDTIKYTNGRRFLQFLVHINFVLPLIVLLMWIRPIGRNILCGKSFTYAKKIFYEDQFEGFRLILILVLCAMRLALMPLFLQSHLNLAFEKIEKMKKESGRITNVELQKMVARVFYYLCVVAIQYIAPVLLIVFLTCMLKTLANLSWLSLFGESAVNYFTYAERTPAKYTSRFLQENSTFSSLFQSASEISDALGDLKSVFTPLWYQGLMSYFLWWSVAAWFTSTCLGMMYYSQES